jgi:hypothetical protein
MSEFALNCTYFVLATNIFQIESAVCMDLVQRRQIEGPPMVITIEQHMHGVAAIHSAKTDNNTYQCGLFPFLPVITFRH